VALPRVSEFSYGRTVYIFHNPSFFLTPYSSSKLNPTVRLVFQMWPIQLLSGTLVILADILLVFTQTLTANSGILRPNLN
jgi:hypothetical protein